MNDEPVAVLLSGGIDSLLMAEIERNAGTLAGCIFVDYGHPAQQAEAWKVFAYCGRHQLRLKVLHAFGLHLGDLDSCDGASVMPHRNAILITMAANVAAEWGVKRIGVGCNQNDLADYADCSPDYLSKLGEVLGVAVQWWPNPKDHIVEHAKSLGLERDDVWSCYQSGFRPCMTCNSCVEFAKAWGEL
jgi:7-cyano-7-deazaguanine synthase